MPLNNPIMRVNIDPTENHSFNVNVATATSIEKAILLKDIKGWCEMNGYNKRNQHEGKSWTFNSAAALSMKYPYMKRRSITRWLNELVEEGYLYEGCFNKAGYDKTKWYSINTEKYLEAAKTLIGQNGQCTGQNGQLIGQNGQPIPSHTISYTEHTPTREEKTSPLAETENVASTDEVNDKPPVNADLTNYNVPGGEFAPEPFELDPESRTPKEVQLVEYAIDVSRDYYTHYGLNLLTDPIKENQLNWDSDRIKKEFRAMWEYYSTEKGFALHEPHLHIHRFWPTWCRNGRKMNKQQAPKTTGFRLGEYQFNG